LKGSAKGCAVPRHAIGLLAEEGISEVGALVKMDRVSFGLFEADLNTGELWKAGFRIRLQGQPFKVLATLVSRAGEVVTREELQLQVWGSNTNVDFERALAGAVNKVREALGDSAENPRFIETLTKRGYRFIAPVTAIAPVAVPSVPVKDPGETISQIAPQTIPTKIGAEGGFPAPAQSALKSAPVLTDSITLIETPALLTRSSRTSWSMREKILGVLAGVLLLTSIGGLWLSKHNAKIPPLRIDQLTYYSPISIGPPNMESLLTLVTDGDRVLTSVIVDGMPRLSAIYTSTGEVQPLTMPSELATNSLADISRDGAKLLLRSHLTSESEQPLWVVPSAGGSALRVGSVLAHDAAWMPDGSILYANANDLFVIQLDTGQSQVYAHLPGRAFWLRWSPNGKLLRFTLMDPVRHSSSIWEIRADNRVAKPVAETQVPGFSVGSGTWTADGSAFVYQVSDSQTSNLWELQGSGTTATRTQLTNGPLRFWSPVASRSGSRIFFMGLDEPAGMQQFSPTTNSFQPAPTFLANANRVDYSRDAAWVAWTDTAGRLWRARAANGSEKLQLTPSWLEVFSARWSPSGKHLVLMARARGSVWQIYLVDAAGGTPEALLHEPRNEADPGWSADGQSLVFGREPDPMGKESGPRTVQILHLKDHSVETLPGSEGLFSPRWSPDGHWIAAMSLDQKSVKLFDVATRRWKDLATTSAADPVWSSDSRSIYLHAFLDDKEPILKVSVPDGAMHVVADLTNFRSGESTNYFFGGVTPSNAPLVQPRIGTGNLYTLDLDRR